VNALDKLGFKASSLRVCLNWIEEVQRIAKRKREAVITTSRQRECRFRAADNFNLDAFAQIAPDYGISLIQINGNGYTSIKVVNALQETGQQCIQEWQRP
jgi:hypothetical protein